MDEELEGFEDDDYLDDIIGLPLVDDEDFDEQDLLDEDEYE